MIHETERWETDYVHNAISDENLIKFLKALDYVKDTYIKLRIFKELMIEIKRTELMNTQMNTQIRRIFTEFLFKSQIYMQFCTPNI